MRERSWLRAGLAFLAAASLVVGVWQLFAPQSFYASFPGFGRSWVSVDGPFNEHLLRDVGGLNLALAFVLGWAAVTPTRAVVFAALGAQLAFAIPHFVYHATNIGVFGAGGDAAGVLAGLAVPLVVPAILLVLAARVTRAQTQETRAPRTTRV